VLEVTDLPALNASLNGLAAVLLTAGFVAIRKRRVHLHRALMISALCTSALFLTSYLIYHYNAGTTRFTGVGWVRPLYFAILISHTFLAVLILPLVLVTLYRALKADFTRHKRIARWTLPAWLYVSVTGIVVYLMLYHLYPSA